MLSIIVLSYLSSGEVLIETPTTLQSIKSAMGRLIDQMMVMIMLDAASDSDTLMGLTDVATQVFFS